jgi:hypothetical protein
MTPDTTLNLGNFQFSGLEIPSQISGIGIAQSLGVHRLVGGDRIIDAMGQDFPPITWSGLFFGANALSRMNALKTMTAAGLPQTLLWHSFNYLVIIRDFSPDERRQYEIPYHITCEVVSDNSTPVTSSTVVSPDDALDNDLVSAQTLTASIADPTLTTLMLTLATAMAAVATFASAPASVLASVLIPLGAAQARVTVLIGAQEIIIGANAGFAGMTAGSSAAAMALALVSTQAAMQEEYELWQAGALLGRMAANLNSINGSPNTLAVVGGNLFQIAAAEYGDATDWTAIAIANGLTDPFLSGPMILTIPLVPGDSGGILSN